MRTVRIALAAAGVPALIVATSAAASAHVTVHPDSAAGGGYSKLTFRVPAESDSASTTKLQVFLPTDHPLASVSVQPHAGWSYKVKTAKLAKALTDDDGNRITRAVSEADWTADSAATAIKPGEFDEFDISVGPLPDSGTMTFKVLQTYSDGSVVRWIDDQESAERPAPRFTLANGDGADAASAAPTQHDAAPRKESRTPLVLSIIALVVAVGGAGLGLLRSRS